MSLSLSPELLLLKRWYVQRRWVRWSSRPKCIYATVYGRAMGIWELGSFDSSVTWRFQGEHGFFCRTSTWRQAWGRDLEWRSSSAGMIGYVLNHSLDTGHPLDKISSIWDAGPFARHFIEWMGHRPIRSALHRVSGPGSHSLNSLSI